MTTLQLSGARSLITNEVGSKSTQARGVHEPKNVYSRIQSQLSPLPSPFLVPPLFPIGCSDKKMPNQ
jgi:hypothetical protein